MTARITTGATGSRARRAAGWVLVALAAFTAFTFRPAALGGEYTFTVVSGDSMEPTFSHGDLVVVKGRATYDPGDVVVPDGPAAGRHVVHRLVGRDHDGWLARGDNRATLDPWRFSDAEIAGAKVAALPSVGRWITSAGSVWVLAAAAGALVTVAVWRPAPGAATHPHRPPENPVASQRSDTAPRPIRPGPHGGR